VRHRRYSNSRRLRIRLHRIRRDALRQHRTNQTRLISWEHADTHTVWTHLKSMTETRAWRARSHYLDSPLRITLMSLSLLKFVHIGCGAVRCRAAPRGTARQRNRCERAFILLAPFKQCKLVSRTWLPRPRLKCSRPRTYKKPKPRPWFQSKEKQFVDNAMLSAMKSFSEIILRTKH